MSNNTVYCYHCGTQHSREDMRLVVSKSGKRWRCKQSIAASKASREQRDAFGRKVTEANKATSQTKSRSAANTPQE